MAEEVPGGLALAVGQVVVAVRCGEVLLQRITRSRTVELGAGSASVRAATFAPVALPAALAALEPLVAALSPGDPTRALDEPGAGAEPARSP